MVCYHTPKSISLDIFELLITATQTNTHKQIRHPTPHSNKHKQTNQTPNPTLKQTQTNKSNTRSHSQPHCSLPITVLSVSSSKIQRYVSLSLLYSSFLNLSFFTIFETQTSILICSSFSLLFFSPHSETHGTVT